MGVRVFVLIAEAWGSVANNVAVAAFREWQKEGCSSKFKFLVTGNKLDPRSNLTEAGFYADQLKRAGVPMEQIVFESEPSGNTHGQAVETREFLDSQGLVPREVEVVTYTHHLHAPRVAALFQNSGIELSRVVAVRYQADRSAPLSVFWMRFSPCGHSVFEKYVAALRDWRAGYITGAQLRRIWKEKMPEGIDLEIVE